MQFWPYRGSTHALCVGRLAALRQRAVFLLMRTSSRGRPLEGGRIRRTAMESMTKRTPFVGNFIFVSRLSSQLPSVILAWNPRCDAEIKHLLVVLRHPLSVFVAFATDE